eukprot:CAMPEP_0171804036 /NCGR_PEP_ID=MMETSP0991-20121206/73839_1 /TAXON_ID=483369 /ORGANISM="non described non described, Strain CCMP2098" /LENGTH=210 /DNA_ID=CAMNT_0012416267 /DNA_START=55 /DNA_END=684 /DNA_ORIENTATION=+
MRRALVTFFRSREHLAMEAQRGQAQVLVHELPQRRVAVPVRHIRVRARAEQEQHRAHVTLGRGVQQSAVLARRLLERAVVAHQQFHDGVAAPLGRAVQWAPPVLRAKGRVGSELEQALQMLAHPLTSAASSKGVSSKSLTALTSAPASSRHATTSAAPGRHPGVEAALCSGVSRFLASYTLDGSAPQAKQPLTMGTAATPTAQSMSSCSS